MLSRSTSIRLEGVGKRYRLGERETYRTLRDSIVRWVRPAKSAPSAERQEIWALKNLDLEVKQGEVLGIIGRNGAGKSTLLKLLSRITTPDSGRIEMHGRVGALLEVGTGFHPELSGRENVYMNGAILGMTRRDIDRKFDQIVAFAGVEEFLDTPVKRYSSGMRVRLGFAVAAHLEPEILVIDEVLAVGDAEFQRKCLGRMNEVAGEGRTVLFVSHQMEAIQSLCSRALWLDRGVAAQDGDAATVVSRYLRQTLERNANTAIMDRKDRTGDGQFQVVGIEVHDGTGGAIQTGGRAEFLVSFRCPDDAQNVTLNVRLAIHDEAQHQLALLDNDQTGDALNTAKQYRQAICQIERMPLVPGRYVLNVGLRANGVLQDKLEQATCFEVLAGDYFNSGKNLHSGIFHIDQSWVMKNPLAWPSATLK